MSTVLSDIQTLSVEEKVELFHYLENDSEVAAYMQSEYSEQRLFEEIEKRDAAYQNGQITLTSIEELERRLKAK